MNSTMYFSNTGMGEHGLYPTLIRRAFAWTGNGQETRSEGDRPEHVQAVIVSAMRKSRRHGGLVGMVGYPTGTSQAGHVDAIDDTPLYTNGAMDVCAIVQNDRVIYGSLYTPWACPFPRN